MCIDYHTRWPEAFAVKSKDAKTFARILVNEICSRHGMPKKLLSDRDQAFLGNVAKELLKMYNIEKINTTSYHAQANGMTERANKSAIQIMKALILQYNLSWPQLLNLMLQKMRIHVNESTGKSPYEMLYGRIPRIPLDLALGRENPEKISNNIVKELAKIHKQAKVVADKMKLKQKFRYDQKRSAPNFKIGDLVLWQHKRIAPYDSKIPKKFKSDKYGPFIIIGKIGKNVVRLKDNQTGQIVSEPVHVEKLFKYNTLGKDNVIYDTHVYEEHNVETDKDEDSSSSSDSDSSDDPVDLKKPVDNQTSDLPEKESDDDTIDYASMSDEDVPVSITEKFYTKEAPKKTKRSVETRRLNEESLRFTKNLKPTREKKKVDRFKPTKK
jgi:hypothetical protein